MAEIAFRENEINNIGSAIIPVRAGAAQRAVLIDENNPRDVMWSAIHTNRLDLLRETVQINPGILNEPIGVPAPVLARFRISAVPPRTALQWSVSQNSEIVAELLRLGANPNIAAPNTMPALMQAFGTQRFNNVHVLLDDSRTDVNIARESPMMRNAFLHQVAQFPQRVTAINGVPFPEDLTDKQCKELYLVELNKVMDRLMARKDLDVNTKTATSATPFLMAVTSFNENAVKHLLSRPECDVDAKRVVQGDQSATAGEFIQKILTAPNQDKLMVEAAQRIAEQIHLFRQRKDEAARGQTSSNPSTVIENPQSVGAILTKMADDRSIW